VIEMAMEDFMKQFEGLSEEEKAKFKQSMMSKMSECDCSPDSMGKMSEMMACCVPMNSKKNEK